MAIRYLLKSVRPFVHNILMMGSPGNGKTLLARALPGILPEMSIEESLDVTRIYSVADQLPAGTPLIKHRPFRAPHHPISHAGLVGGGNIRKPGEISLAHRGVLFLDEFSEFGTRVLEVMRQPMEDKVVTISRAKGSLTFSANFQLIAAMNPCPCGFYGDPQKLCTCLVILSSNCFSIPALAHDQCRAVDVCSGGKERNEPARPDEQNGGWLATQSSNIILYL